MPNINAKVAAACSAYCTNNLVTDEEKKEIEKIFGAVGTILALPESSFSLFGVLAGCSPAFVYMFIDALARAGVKNGMKKDVALKIAAQSVLGSAKLISESDTHPFDLIDQVCSRAELLLRVLPLFRQMDLKRLFIKQLIKQSIRTANYKKIQKHLKDIQTLRCFFMDIINFNLS